MVSIKTKAGTFLAFRVTSQSASHLVGFRLLQSPPKGGIPMVKLTKYTGDTTYVLGNGELGTKARMLALWPAALTVTHVAETDEAGECLLAFDPLSRLRSVLDIDRSLDEEAAIRAIEALRNRASESAPPDPAERLAAALEFQNVLSLARDARGEGRA